MAGLYSSLAVEDASEVRRLRLVVTSMAIHIRLIAGFTGVVAGYLRKSLSSEVARMNSSFFKP